MKKKNVALKCRVLAKKLLEIADKEGNLEVYSYNYNDYFVRVTTDLLTTTEVEDGFRQLKYEQRELGGESNPKAKNEKRVVVLFC